MNWDAWRENTNNERHIQLHGRQGKLVLEIERKEVTYNGRKWLDLSTHDKRKFENKLFMQYAHYKRPLVYLYV